MLSLILLEPNRSWCATSHKTLDGLVSRIKLIYQKVLIMREELKVSSSLCTVVNPIRVVFYRRKILLASINTVMVSFTWQEASGWSDNDLSSFIRARMKSYDRLIVCRFPASSIRLSGNNFSLSLHKTWIFFT